MAPSPARPAPTTSAPPASSSATTRAFLPPPARRPGPRFPRLARVHRAVQHQRALALGLGRRAALGQVVPDELPHHEREPQHDLLQGVDLDGSTCRARATAPGSTRAATTSRACRATTGRSSCPSCTRSSTTTSASTARRRSAARSTFDVNVTSLTREATHFSQIPNTISGCSTRCRPTRLLRDLHRLRARRLPRARHERRPSPGSRPSSPGGATSSTRSGRSGRPSPMSGRTAFCDQARHRRLPEFANRRTSSAATTTSSAGSCRRSGSNTATRSSRRRGDSGTHVLEPIAQIIARPERDAHRPPAERGRPEPRLRRHVALRLEQVLRLRPRRGRRARQYRRRNTRFTGANGFYANALVRPVLPARRPELVPPRRPRQCRPRFGARVARAPTTSARLLISPNKNFSFVDPRPLRPERFRDAPARDAADDELQPRPAAHDLGDLRQYAAPARARLRPPPRRPSQPQRTVNVTPNW